jgi:hypothetical protein
MAPSPDRGPTNATDETARADGRTIPSKRAETPGNRPLTHAADTPSRRTTGPPALAVYSGAGCCSPHLEMDPSQSVGPQRHREAATLLLSVGPGFVFQLELGCADRLVDHLPDFLVQLVLLPDAVRGPQQHRRYSDQPDCPAHRRIDPLVTPRSMLS